VQEKLSYRYVPNGRFVYAKLGSKRGAERSLRMLPDLSDLVGDGWKVLAELRWRTGRMGNVSDWGVRARRIRSVTAYRSFEQTGASRWLWAEVMPLATDADSAAALTDLPSRFLRNPRAKRTITGERSVLDVTVPGTLSTWAYEQATTGTIGNGVSRYLGGAVGSVVFLVAASGTGDGWPWDEVVSIANVVVRRITTPEKT
jgi:hypothetical protein